jgi:hypothetical protein
MARELVWRQWQSAASSSASYRRLCFPSPIVSLKSRYTNLNTLMIYDDNRALFSGKYKKVLA